MFLYNLIIAPIEMIVDWVFTFFYTKLHMLGAIGAIYGVSITINFLALPLYNIADSLQEKERVVSKKLEYRVKRIKKAFKGDEQFMMLSEYYRQNNYHPLYTLRSSLSILIEIPFFIAAYHYLSHATYLEQAAVFSWISDLSAPDSLLNFYIGSKLIKINILPIIMTLINFVSGFIYTRNSTLRDKIQLYAMGIFFLVILYGSPSGLVIYWILNNIFSLVKTIVLKTKKPRLVGRIVVTVFILALVAFLYNVKRRYSYVLLALAILVALWPFICKLLYKLFKGFRNFNENSDTKGFLAIMLLSGLGLMLLCGLVLPSSAIATSPIEFSFIGNTEKPSAYVWRSLIVFAGLFVFWPFCIYKMFNTKVKKWETLILLIAFIAALTNAFIFKSDYGTIDTQFFVADSIDLSQVSALNMVGPVLVVIATIALFILLRHYNKLSWISFALFSFCIAECIIGGIKVADINSTFKEYKKNLAINAAKTSQDSNGSDVESIYHLTKTGKNVIVLFLDRAYGPFFPYALEELPELREQFRGFVYYPNTVGFSRNTQHASPAMMGGYEYSPENINKRSDVLLFEKHNEAILLSPVLFDNAGYDVTVSDVPYPNYSDSGDLTIFDTLSDRTRAFEIIGNYTNIYKKEVLMASGDNTDEITYREARSFAILQIIAPIARDFFNSSFRTKDEIVSYEAFAFMRNFPNLYYFRQLTDFEGVNNQYIFIDNNTTHSPVYLDSTFTSVAAKDPKRRYAFPYENDWALTHYSSFCAALKQVGIWLDYLRENGAYDNTRIVIVSDHGISDLAFDSTSAFKPLLMFKDFDCSEEVQSDEELMTNADSGFLARQDLEEIDNINPFTGNELVRKKENGVNAWSYIDVGVKKTKYQFILTDKNSFHVIPGDILNPDNWIPMESWNKDKGGNR